MIKHILPLIPKHTCYVEPFVGGGAVFWAKQQANVEVINDKDERVITFYKVVQTQFDELRKMLDCTLHSKAQYSKAKEILQNPEQYSDVERAWAFWVQTNMSFARKIYGGFASSRKTNDSLKSKNKLARFTKEYCERLKNTVIDCDDALKIINRYDSPETFFYIDPPYVSSYQGHYDGYTEADFIALLDTLAEIEGKFLLSCYPEPVLQEYVEKNGWDMQTIDMVLSANNPNQTNSKRGRKTEVLIRNYGTRKELPLFNGCIKEMQDV